MVRTDRWKYCYYPDGFAELYDLKMDPQEKNNLAGQPAHRDMEEKMKTLILNWLINSSETDQIQPRWLLEGK
jgi:hypothetical protein